MDVKTFSCLPTLCYMEAEADFPQKQCTLKVACPCGKAFVFVQYTKHSSASKLMHFINHFILQYSIGNVVGSL